MAQPFGSPVVLRHRSRTPACSRAAPARRGCGTFSVRSGPVEATKRLIPPRADVLRTHRAVGLRDQAPRVGELAQPRPVLADGEELVAVGIRAEGIAFGVEHEYPRRRVQAEWYDDASRAPGLITSVHGVRWLGEVRELAQARADRADGEELAV